MSDDDHGATNGGDDPKKDADRKPATPDDKSDAIDWKSIQPAEGFDGLADVTTWLQGLAELPEHAYEAIRRGAAKGKGWRVSRLDAAVKSMRAQGGDDGGQDRPIVLPEIELHPAPVVGDGLIADLIKQIQRFIVMDDAAALAVALWVVFAHAHEAAFHSPRLALLSPVHRCGKSSLMRVIGMLVVRKVPASSVTASAMFRLISAAGGLVVLLIDEFDQVDAEKASELVAVVNAGHCKLDAYVIRTVPIAGDLRPRQFDCWAPTVVASNKALPVTWMDRSITLRLRRKPQAEPVDRLRDDLDLGFDDLARRAARWAADNVDQLRGADPALPAVLNDRQADNWRMLVAIADLAGCGERARDAAVALSVAETEDKQARGELLLQDIRAYFDQTGEDRSPSLHLAVHLAYLEGRPWAEYSHGKPLSTNQLATLLRPFGIRPNTIRVDDPVSGSHTPKGYMREAFEPAWNRYLSPPPHDQTATTPQATESARSADSQGATPKKDVAPQESLKATASKGCGVVAVRDPPARESHAIPKAMRGRLRKHDVHEGVIAELRFEDARRMLDAPETVYANARRAPAEDLVELAKIVAGYDSRDLASTASSFANRVEITASVIDAIKAGTMVQFAVRDAIWAALS